MWKDLSPFLFISTINQESKAVYAHFTYYIYYNKFDSYLGVMQYEKSVILESYFKPEKHAKISFLTKFQSIVRKLSLQKAITANKSDFGCN